MHVPSVPPLFAAPARIMHAINYEARASRVGKFIRRKSARSAGGFRSADTLLSVQRRWHRLSNRGEGNPMEREKDREEEKDRAFSSRELSPRNIKHGADKGSAWR